MRTFIALTISIMATALAATVLADEPRHPWDLPIGTGFLLRSEDGGLSTYYEVVDIVETEAGTEYHVTTTRWSSFLYYMSQVFLEAPDGNLYLTEAVDLVTGDRYWFDPPLLYLELPLHAGQEFEARSTSYGPAHPEGEFQHHRLTVDEIELETPAGTFNVLRMSDDPVAGSSNGEDYFHPELGMIGTRNGTTGELRLLVNHTNGYPDDSLGWGQEVTPTFGWKPGMSWKINRRTVIYPEESEDVEPIVGDYEYTIAAEMLPQDMLIRRGDFGIPYEVDPAELGEDFAKLMELMDAVKTRHVVDSEGRFQALASKKQQEETAKLIIETIQDLEAEGDIAKIQELMGPLAGMIDPQFLEQAAAIEWNYMVGNWVGTTFTLGSVVPFTYSNPAGRLWNLDIPMNAILMATGRRPCEEDGEGDDCLEILMSGVSDDSPGLEYVTMLNSVRVLMDPEGMFPHKILIYDSTKIEGHPTVPDQYLSGFEILWFEKIDEGAGEE